MNNLFLHVFIVDTFSGQQHLLFLSDSSQQIPTILRNSPEKADGKTSNNE